MAGFGVLTELTDHVKDVTSWALISCMSIEFSRCIGTTACSQIISDDMFLQVIGSFQPN
jgi:hypothetical protein